MLRGALAAALTPLRDAGEALDEEVIAPYVDFLLAGGLDGLLALGSTGEGFLLPVEQRMRAAQLFVEAANGRLPVAVHCGAQSTWDTVELAAHAADVGADAVAVMAPPYFTLDETALLSHFGAAARACAPTPFYVYEFAARSGYAVPIPVIERLRGAAANFRGLKVSDTPWERFAPYLIEGLDVFVGPEALLPQGLAAGAAGAVSALASGSTGKAMGGVRQQFSSAAEVRLAQESIAFFEELGAAWFQQVGYLFLATTAAGLAELEERRELQAELGVPVERVDPGFVRGLAADDVVGAVFCPTDGGADPPTLPREAVRRAAELGVEVRERTDARELERDVLVIAAGAYSGEFGVELPIRPLARQLLETEPIEGLPDDLPMVIEAESGFHFRRRDDCLRIAMADDEPRWGFEETVDESVFEDRLARLAQRYPPAAGTAIARAWAGLYDMTPDAHPIIGPVGDGLYAACGFSGHGFMQSPAVGRAVAEELLRGESEIDLASYRLERFEDGTAL